MSHGTSVGRQRTGHAVTRRSLTGPALRIIGHLEPLDRPAERLAAAVREVVRARRVKDVLSGSWLGHAVHPMLVVVPIGSWTGAAALDLVRGSEAACSSELLIALGVAGAVPAVATGVSDWAESERSRREVRRIGLLHGATNSTVLALHVASLVQRRRGRCAAGVRLSRRGFCVLVVGDWLGGHVAFARGVGVNRAAFDDAPHQWTRVVGADRVGDGHAARARADDGDFAIVRRNGAIYALADRCGHCGGSLSSGRLVGDSIQCPRNATRFRPRDGAIVLGPSAYPQPVFEAREHDGHIEVRARQD